MKTTKRFDKIGRMLVAGALNDTKKVRKAGADIFRAGTVNKNNFRVEWVYLERVCRGAIC